MTAHDGFTLTDLVSYNDKHNEANGEANRDGESHNRSWNCGDPALDEGPTDDPAVIALRARQRRNLMATLLLSQGVPMLLGGDELGRTQQGNNNAYCQDNEISWYDWADADPAFTEWCRTLVALRRDHPVFRRRRWFQGHPIRGTEEVLWLRPDGVAMTDNDWDNGYAKSLGVLLDGEAITTADAYGGRVTDDSYLVLLNASELDLPWELPGGAVVAAVGGRARQRRCARTRHRVRRRRHRHDRATLARRAALAATDRPGRTN